MSFNTLFWMIGVGFVGGLLNARKNKSKLTNIGDWVFNIATSMFLGWIAFEIVCFLLENERVGYAVGGFVAFQGASWFNHLVDSIIKQKIKGE